MTAEQIEAIWAMRLMRTILQETVRSQGLVVGGEGMGTGPGASSRRRQGDVQPLPNRPNTSGMLLDQPPAVPEGRLK